MALNFGSSVNDGVSVSAASSINDFTAFTGILWIRPTGFFTGGRRIFQKGPSGGNRKQVNWTVNAAVDVTVLRATTNSNSTTPNSTFTANTWYCLCVTYDESAGVKIYYRTLTTDMAESSYAVQTVGSGSTNNDNSAGFGWGNGPSGSSTAAHVGDIACGAYFNRVLTLGEMRAWSIRRRVISGCALYHELGWNGTGTQPDWSGNGNAGTVSGPTVVAHAPLSPPFAPNEPPGIPFIYPANLSMMAFC